MIKLPYHQPKEQMPFYKNDMFLITFDSIKGIKDMFAGRDVFDKGEGRSE